jgi:hypothetical protein
VKTRPPKHHVWDLPDDDLLGPVARAESGDLATTQIRNDREAISTPTVTAVSDQAKAAIEAGLRISWLVAHRDDRAPDQRAAVDQRNVIGHGSRVADRCVVA